MEGSSTSSSKLVLPKYPSMAKDLLWQLFVHNDLKLCSAALFQDLYFIICQMKLYHHQMPDYMPLKETLHFNANSYHD